MSDEGNWNFKKLNQKVATYMNSADVKMVKKAYQFAKNVHKDQLRKSGLPYIVHPLQVAGILSELKMGVDTICAGLLHDVVRNSHISIEKVTQSFGTNIAFIVSGVTKINQMRYKSHSNQLALNYRKMLLSISHDIRIIIVKLADCLDNMRTLKYLDSKKQIQIANETLAIYAPLADRLGIGAIKWELEDLSLRYLDPDQYYLIAHLMHSKRTQRVAYINMAVHDVEKVIANLHIKVEVYGRPKHIYSIYRKMHNKHKKFNQIYDLLALRVITHSIKDCYAVLGAIQSKWKPVNGRFKDYIANPKRNLYQSLHTTFLGPQGKLLEAQIRTAKMHQIAEYGVAAHWAYKEGIKSKIRGSSDNYKLNEYKHVIEQRESGKNDDEINENINEERSSLFDNNVYIFTPRGDVLELPKDSRPLDVAYSIHTEVGNHTTGATVNGKIVPLDHGLKTGDVVDILTSSNASPSRDWLNLVTGNKTKRKIKQYFRQHDKEHSIILGKEILNKKVKDDDYDPRQVLTDKRINDVAQAMHYRNMDSLLAMIGFGDVQPEGVVKRLTKNDREIQEKEQRAYEQEQILSQHHALSGHNESENNSNNKRANNGVVIEGIDNLLIHLSHCCYPIPGDPIVGYITKGHGVAIHRKDCPNIKEYEATGQRIVNAHWANSNANDVNYSTILKINGYNRNGLLNDVMKKINSVTKQVTSVEGKVGNRETVSITIYLYLHNLRQYQVLEGSLKHIEDIYSVQRVFQ